MPSSRPDAATNLKDPNGPSNPPGTEPPQPEPLSDNVVTGQKRIMRSRESKVFAGVAGGLGRHFGIDPVIVRVALVVLVLTTSGLFLVLYGAAIFIIPKEPKATALVNSESNDESRQVSRSSLGAAVLIGIGLLALSDNVGLNIDGDFLWPLAFIGFGVAVLWSRRSPAETPPEAHRVGAYDPTDEAHPFRTLVDSHIVQRAYDRVVEPVATAKLSGRGKFFNSQQQSQNQIRSRGRYSTVATAGFLVVVAAAWILLRSARLDVSPRPALGSALVVVGVLFVIGSWMGRPKLLSIGIILTLLLGVSASAGVRLNGGIGERNLILRPSGTPAKPADVPTAKYNGVLTQKPHLDVGALTIDTRSVSNAATLGETLKNPRLYDVGVGILTIVVAPDVNLLLDAKVGGGNINVDGDALVSGMDQSTTRTIPATKPPTEGKVRTLRLGARVGLGAVVVIHAAPDVKLADITEDVDFEYELERKQ
jgi:phage shock protein PspC (stress-responsive transcriptional regulator)